jgi:predicted RNA-binding Zn-ribbon protein involved in translation (DUF1610 family)
MILSCECPDWEGDPGTWAYIVPDDFSRLETKRRRRCSSCKDLINIGSECLRFERIRAPYTDIEAEIVGDDAEIPMSPFYQCEKCGEIYFNLNAIGYCISPDSNMEELLKEYWEMTGFKGECNANRNG